MKSINSYKKIILQVIVSLFLLNTSSTAQSIYAYGYNFTTSTRTYNYLTSGTPLTSIQVDDNYATVPIGFTFTFCGVDYTDVTICSNGWVRFGTGPGAAPANWNYNPTQSISPYPAVYFLYEDITGDYATATYKTTGSAPNRIFIFEFKNLAWDYASTSPCASVQVLLYETTGVIECMYKQEAGTVALNTSGGATIGIHNTVNDYQVLDGVGSAPVSSSSTWTSTLAAVPATGQVYKWDPGPICQSVAPVTLTNLSSKGASFSWTAITGASYEFAVTSSATPPSTGAATVTTSNVTVNGLMPATSYYLHVRHICSSVSYSQWTTYNFTTRPDCSKPGKTTIVAVDTNSAIIQWPSVSPATSYQYIIDMNNSTPSISAGALISTTPVINKGGLTEGTWYYIHYRSLCLGNDSSAWSLDSFRTPIPCRKPVITITYLSSSSSIASWSPVNTALQYEYYLGPLTSLPSSGTPLITNFIHSSFLQPSTDYTISVRSICNDFGVSSASPWSSIDFTTPAPAGISTLNVDNVPLTIYPNPARDKITFNLNGYNAVHAKVTITDVSGKIIRAVNIENNVTDIDLKGVTTGIYLLRYVDGENTKVAKITVE
ncbi:MAG: T9SS type A sorting domain-containing protein [Bacteroidetes bacterium]|nr:T9SS type A sorting domain-containing protein [Bacteroidota bacterium]